VVLFPFANEIYAFVSKPLRDLLPENASMIATEVASPFLTPFKLTLFTALFRRHALRAVPGLGVYRPGNVSQ
jgi:sec-independent protein translocase protein TatC